MTRSLPLEGKVLSISEADEVENVVVTSVQKTDTEVSYTSSVTFGDSFSSRRSLAAGAEPPPYGI